MEPFAALERTDGFVDYQRDPSRYRHWRVAFEGPIATITMDVDEDGGLRPGYRLKLNSYDLGVDIELHDIIQRVRFEHPEVRAVVITSAKKRVFSAGANIYMLGMSTHAWKVNFCKFTNETRNAIEDASRHSGIKFIAACNGTTAGGGYELALACDEIILVDDRSSAVSLPEVALLGVLPGTGGLTRLTDKRRVRRDRADVFCTDPDGVRGQRAQEWGLVDRAVRTQEFAETVRRRAHELAQQSDRPVTADGVKLPPLDRTIHADGICYRSVDVAFDRSARTATFLVHGPDPDVALTIADASSAGASWWPLQMARELDDAILSLRTNEPELGLWILKTVGNPDALVALDGFLVVNQSDWFIREVLGMLRRTFARLDVSSRSTYAIVTPESCFAGTLLELALAADRVYMLDADAGTAQATMTLSAMNFGPLPMGAGHSRLAMRFYHDREALDRLEAHVGVRLTTRDADALGLVTAAPDMLDWDDELRQAVETRTALSGDALSGLEANLRFGLPETQDTRVFGRLSAWQNWIFVRPNAVGPSGALKVYGTGAAVGFDRERV
jgi:benzoyl-CoA-dihydrodiol lyase